MLLARATSCTNVFLVFLILCIVIQSVRCKIDDKYKDPSKASKIDVGIERQRVLDLFHHGYSQYMEHAFPLDELCPLSCSGRNTIGNFSLTLIDSLDMLAIVGDLQEFRKQIIWIQGEEFSLDINVNVSTFETNIRVLGGLLSAHILAEDLLEGYPWNREPLLTKAIELGDILAKAFNTPTGIPYGTINLANGGSVPPKETTITSLATAGTFIIEFGVLSKLTGNPIYQNLAKDSLLAIWNHRSENSLFGNHIDINTGRWTSAETSIGGNSDSFYEYLLKGAILFGDSTLKSIFDESYEAIMKHVYYKPWYVKVNMNTVAIVSATFESLQGFWPGLQVLLGDIEKAAETMHAFQSIWQQHGFVPEIYDLHKDKLVGNREQYPLRPEMAESLYYLYTATKDPIWLQYGREIINSLEKFAKVPCGVAAIESVRTKEKRDHMDSFFLSETCKYLYLLFTPEHPIVKSQKFVFNTEGHPFPLRYAWLNDESKVLDVGQCIAPSLATQLAHGNFQPIRHHAARFDDLSKLQTIRKKISDDRNNAEQIDGVSDVAGSEDGTDVDSVDSSSGINKLIANTYGLVMVKVLKPIGTENDEALEQTVFLANFGMQQLPDAGISGYASRTIPLDGCGELEGSTKSLEGQIAIVNRGRCEFLEKVRNCQSHGAIATVVVNNNEHEDHNISMSGEADDITIPSALVSNSFGTVLDSILAFQELKLLFTQDGVDTENQLDNAVIIDLSKFDTTDPENFANYFDSVFQSLGVANSEELTQKLTDMLHEIDMKEAEDEDVIMDFDFLGGYNNEKVVGKQMRNCIDGEC